MQYAFVQSTSLNLLIPRAACELIDDKSFV